MSESDPASSKSSSESSLLLPLSVSPPVSTIVTTSENTTTTMDPNTQASSSSSLNNSNTNRQIVIEASIQSSQQQQQQNAANKKQYTLVLPSQQKNPQQQQQQLPTVQLSKVTSPLISGLGTMKPPNAQQPQLLLQQQQSPKVQISVPVHTQSPNVSIGVNNTGGSVQSGHRTRKEKLICRSVTDSSLSSSMSITPIIMASQAESSSTNSPRASSSSSSSSNTSGFHPESGSPPRKTVKKAGALPGTPRPYRKKHGAVPVKSIIDPLNRESYDQHMSNMSKAGMMIQGGNTTTSGQGSNGTGGINNNNKLQQGDNPSSSSSSSAPPQSILNPDKPAKRAYRKRNAGNVPATGELTNNSPRQKRKYNKTKNKKPPLENGQPPDSPESALKKKLGRPRKTSSPLASTSTLTQQEINQQQLQQLLRQQQQQSSNQQQQQQQDQQKQDGQQESNPYSSNLSKYHDPYEMLRLHLKDKKAPDLRVFGSPNVMPIFKPGQKPWILLSSLINGTEKEKAEAARLQAAAVETSSLDSPYDSNVKTQTINATSTPTNDSSTSTAASSIITTSQGKTTSGSSKKELEVVAVPVDFLGDKFCFSSSGEDQVLFEYLLSRQPKKDDVVLPNQPTITNSTNAITLDSDETKDKNSNVPSATIVTNLHLSSLEAPNRKHGSSIAFMPPPSPTAQINQPLQQQSSLIPQSLDYRPLQNLSSTSTNNSSSSSQPLTSILPESSQFMPIQTGYQPITKLPNINTGGGSLPGRESPATPSATTTTTASSSSTSGSFLPPSRFQAPSPSPSSVSGGSNSGRRYSRRRHSRLHPAFEQERCLFSNHSCQLPVAYGSTYCIKHLPERYSPYYVRCSFFSGQSRRRCPNLQYSHDGKKKFCDMHASRLALHRQKICRKPRPSKTFQDDTNEIKRIIEQTKRPQRCELAFDFFFPLISRNFTKSEKAEAVAYLEDLCDYKLQTQCMEYQMDEKGPTDIDGTVESLGQFQAEYDSDGGVETGEKYECLKNAGYYTTEEVVSILQSKLCRLRQLYIKEFDFIKFYYLMKRRDYLLAEEKLKSHSVVNGSGTGTVYTSDPKDLIGCRGASVAQFCKDTRAAKNINSLLNYKKLRGEKALFHHIARKRYEEIKEKEAAETRTKTLPDDIETESESEDEKKTSVIDDLLSQAKSLSRSQTQSKKPKDRLCIFHENTEKCREKAMPGLKHCLAHVVQDEKQCLFERCTYPLDQGETCPTIIFKRIDKGRCSLHRRVYIKDLGETGNEEDKTRLKLKSTWAKASKEEAQSMFEDLLAKEVHSMSEFDAIVQDILSKGLDCSDTEYTYSGSEDDEGVGRDFQRRARTVDGSQTQDPARSFKTSSSSRRRQPSASSTTTATTSRKTEGKSRQRRKRNGSESTNIRKTTTKSTAITSRRKVGTDGRTKLVVSRKITPKTQSSRTKEKVNRAKAFSHQAAQVKRKHKKKSKKSGKRRRSKKSVKISDSYENVEEEEEEDEEVKIEAVIENDDGDDEVNDPDVVEEEVEDEEDEDDDDDDDEDEEMVQEVEQV